MPEKNELMNALEGVLLDFLKGVKGAKSDDLKEYAKKIAFDAVDLASHGHARVPQELLAQMLLITEIYRIRLTTKIREQLVAAVQSAVGILVKVL